MVARIHFVGPAPHRLRSAAGFAQSVVEVSARRLLKGPRRPGWNWFVEVATLILKRQVKAVFTMQDVEAARRYLDSVSIRSPALSAVSIRQVVRPKFRGSWLAARDAKPDVTLLYFHGGGYSFYPKAYSSFIAQIALATKSRAFALDYRLSPEHRFPAQLEDALSAYGWLLETGIDPATLVVAGDSAGGNLVLALLLKARDSNLPLPTLAIALSPPTNFATELLCNEEFDWIDKRSLLQWRDWFCDPDQRLDPLVSPLWASLRGLPPIYMQAGRVEMLYDSIQAFADHGKEQGADVVLDTWEDMNHVFQIFAPDAPQSSEALQRIADVIDLRIQRHYRIAAMSAADV